MITRRRVLIALGAGVLAPPFASNAQQKAAGIPRIGYLSTGSQVSNGAFLQAFREGLRELGYIDGKNIVIDVRWVGVAAYEFPQVAASMVKTNPAAIVGTCVPSTKAAKSATSTIPVVMSINGDPVSAGLVASLAHPGGNVTGTSTLFEELIPKWLQLIRTAAPKARTVAVMVNPDSLNEPYWWDQIEIIATKTGVKLVRAQATTPAGLENAFDTIRKQHAQALIVMPDANWAGQVQRIVTLAGVHKLPAIYGFREFADAGGLMSYGISFREYYRNVARYVARVIQGTKPADLPIERPTRIELVVNLATARKLGVSIPQQLLARADKVIE